MKRSATRLRSLALLFGPRTAFALRAALIVAAAGLYFVNPGSNLIERYYSKTFYWRLERLLTPLSNQLPFALCDLLAPAVVLAIPVWWAIRFKGTARGKRLGVLARLSFSTLALAGAVLIAFDGLWGLNYERESLANKLDYDQARVTVDAVKGLAATTVTQLNLEAPAAHSEVWPSFDAWSAKLRPSFEPVSRELTGCPNVVPGRVKRTVGDRYMTATGIEGFTNPFGLEVILNRGLLPLEQPFAIAHEWSHLAGLADESEANFSALLVCLRSGDPAVRYAGWLELYLSLFPLIDSEPTALPVLTPIVRADLTAIDKRRVEQTSPWLSSMQWRFYDRFLKANGVREGVASYGLFIRLTLGTKFQPGWVPIARTKPQS